jgi:cyclopropane fatty-acyl-phospholipid synthase-like methyltransferase
LDIGGSTGVVAHYLSQEYDLSADVLDPSPEELAEAERRGLETIVGLLEDYDPGGRRFDMVLLCQTVDHLLDVRQALTKVCQLLDERGLFFIDIVDFRAAYLRNWRVEQAIKIDHPYYFTEATIEAYLGRAGFDVLAKNYADDHLHIGYVARKGSPKPSLLPSRQSVADLLREIRSIQNAPRGTSI